MGKIIKATKKPIQIQDAADLVVTVPNKAGNVVPLAVLAVTEPLTAADVVNKKKRIRFHDEPTKYEATSLLPTQVPWVFWYSKAELKDLSMQTKRDIVNHRRLLDDCMIGDDDDDDDEDFSTRGLEAFFGTNAASVQRFRREHIRNVLGMAKRPGCGSMLAQFARQSSGKSGSTRAAHLRGLADEQVARKLCGLQEQSQQESSLEEEDKQDDLTKPAQDEDSVTSTTSTASMSTSSSNSSIEM